MDLSSRNALSELLQSPTPERQASDYEKVFDDFVRSLGGNRVDALYPIPSGVLNADYHLVTDAFELVLELKQMNTYRPGETADSWFNDLIAKGRYLGPPPVHGSRITVTPENFSPQDWRRFYLKFRPSVTTHLDKAAKQLKDTVRLLPPASPDRPRLFGSVMLNTNDFNLSTDLLFRLIECRTKEKWRRGLYSHLHFVFITSMDLLQEDCHPLHSRGIVRSHDEARLADGAHFLFQQWVRYGAAAVGAEVRIEPGELLDSVRVDAPVLGKLRWTPEETLSPS